MPNNKNDIHAATSRMDNAEDLLRKLSDYAHTDPQALSDFFDDRELVQLLIEKLKQDPELEKQCYVLFATLTKQTGQEILKTLYIESDEDPLLVGLLFQNPYMAETLLNKLKKDVTADELFIGFFAKLLQRLHTGHSIENVLICRALLQCLSLPLAHSMSKETVAALQTALTPDQARLTINAPLQTAFVNGLVYLSQEECDKKVRQLAAITTPQPEQQNVAAQEILTRIFNIHYERAANFGDWISIPHQQNYCLAFCKYFPKPNPGSIATEIPKEYIRRLADCLSDPAVLTGRTGNAIISGLQQSLTSESAALLSTLLLNASVSFSTDQVKNIIKILSTSEQDAQFCMHYLENHTHSFSQALTQQQQKAFVEILKSIPDEATKKQLSADILVKVSNPPGWRARLVNALPSWLCPNSLLKSALKSMAFDPAQIGALCEVVGQEKSQALIAESRLLNESVRLFRALPVSAAPTATPVANIPRPIASHGAALATTMPSSVAAHHTTHANSWATPPISIAPPRPAIDINWPVGPVSTLATTAKKAATSFTIDPEIKAKIGFKAAEVEHPSTGHTENYPVTLPEIKQGPQANCGYVGGLFTRPSTAMAPKNRETAPTNTPRGP
jgi:hypothetical protein